jgi:hypothetical protein
MMGFYNCNSCGDQVHTSRLPSNVCEKCEDTIKFPKHYNASEVQPIDAIEAWGLGFHLGNVVKYIARAGKKDPNKIVEDLKKARWYLDRHIEKLEKK